MPFEFWFTLAVFLFLTFALAKELLPPEVLLFSALLALAVAEVITVDEAFSGFSNQGMITIALLFIVSGSLQMTGALDKVSSALFGSDGSSLKKLYARALAPVAFFSMFLNNTPIVAMLIPGARRWAEKHGAPVSKILIPISYAAILGGMITLIGTSTNLILHGLLVENGFDGFGFFELAKIGAPIAVVGTVYLILFGGAVLPDRRTPTTQAESQTREYVAELKITAEYEHIGKTVRDAGLRHLTGLYLFQIEREGEVVASVKPNEIIREDDRLFFVGLPKTILEFQKTPGMALTKDSHFDLKHYDSEVIKPYEAVVSRSSRLAGVTVRDADFRTQYGAVIIAIHRNGERIQKKIGDVALQAGDTLLLLADSSFYEKWRRSAEFYLVSTFDEVPSKPKWHALFASVTFLTMLTLGATGAMPLITAMGVAAALLIIFGSVSGTRALSMIDWRTLLVIASSFGVAVAMEKSGVGEFFADRMIDLVAPLGPVGLVAGVYLMTAIYTNFITNNTAAVLMFPIALSAAQSMGLAPLPLIVAVAIGASSSFATPISYQTNLMVYGPGGYRFGDFTRAGAPLQIIAAAIAVALISFHYL